MLAIIAAIEAEVVGLRRMIQRPVRETRAGVEMVRGFMEGIPVLVVRSGVGKVNAALATQMVIDHHRPRAILVTGVAGALTNDVAAGDIVIGRHLMQYDLDLTAFGHQLGHLPDGGAGAVSDPRLVTLAGEAARVALAGEPLAIHVGTVVSGDGFVSDRVKKAWLVKTFGAVATEMEGAAIGYVCQRNGAPFVVVRAISDSACEQAPASFGDNLAAASGRAHRVVKALVPLIASRGSALAS